MPTASKHVRKIDRAQFLVSRFAHFDGLDTEEAQRLLLKMGKRAHDALIEGLADPENGWTAAMLLGKIGIPTPKVIKALRARADENWCASALGMLGDHAWLVKQDRAIAVDGLLAPLKAIAQGDRPHALDYRPLEAYLAATPAARKSVETELQPGSSYVSIQTSDVEEALRGLSSKHAAIRWHAASVLGERRLGIVAGKLIVAALAKALGDRNAYVRRLAILSLSYWKSTARPYHAAMRALREDTDPVVRSVAAKTPAS